MSCIIGCGPQKRLEFSTTLTGYRIAFTVPKEGASVTDSVEISTDTMLVLMAYVGMTKALQMTRRGDDPLDFNRLVTVTL